MRVFNIKWSLYILLILSAATATGQDSTGIFFQGRILDSKTLTPLPGSLVTVNRKIYSVSDDLGDFALNINVKDTVNFSRIGYKTTSLVIPDTLVSKKYVAGIFMNSDTVEIGEVIIIPGFANLKSEVLNSKFTRSQEMENARYNVAVSGYHGRTSTGKLGDPDANYRMIQQRSKIAAFEKGGIPSDQIAGISPFILLPAAYLLMHGLPPKPEPMEPVISDAELDRIIKNYLEKQRK